MKKKFLLSILTLISTFAFFTKANALTKVNFMEINNGEVNATIHFEEGFVGGLDITFKVDGDVIGTDFVFATKIQEGNYTKNFSFNEKEHTINVKVTSGGIAQAHNLLNENKELNLGKIIFTTSAKESLNYSLKVSSLIYIDNNWQSNQVSSSHLTLGDKTSFNYQVENKEEPPIVEDNNDSEEKNDEETNLPDNTEENNTGNSSSNNSNNDSDKNSNIPKDDEDDSQQESSDKNIDDKTFSEDSESISKTDIFLIGTIIGIISLSAIIGLIIIKR